MHGGGHGDLGQAGGHELQQRHLGGGVLHGDAVGVEVGVAAAPLDAAGLGVAEVVDQDLLGEGERATEALAAERDPLGEAAVDAVDQLDGGVGGDGHGA